MCRPSYLFNSTHLSIYDMEVPPSPHSNSTAYDTQSTYPPRRPNTTFQYRALLPPMEEIKRHRNRLRSWIVSILSFMILYPLISTMTGLHSHARDLSYKPTPEMIPFVGRQVLMELVLVAADPIAQTMTLDWTFLGEETSPCSATNLTGCTDLNVFFDK